MKVGQSPRAVPIRPSSPARSPSSPAAAPAPSDSFEASSARGYGRAHFAATELGTAIDRFFDRLSSAPVRDSFGASAQWSVVDAAAAKPSTTTKDAEPKADSRPR